MMIRINGLEMATSDKAENYFCLVGNLPSALGPHRIKM